jgi:hypothetical protein
MGALSDTSDTTFRHVLLTDDGGQIRFFANHGRLYVTKQSRDGRHQVTTPVELERVRLLIRRLSELCVVASADSLSQES